MAGRAADAAALHRLLDRGHRGVRYPLEVVDREDAAVAHRALRSLFSAPF